MNIYVAAGIIMGAAVGLGAVVISRIAASGLADVYKVHRWY